MFEVQPADLADRVSTRSFARLRAFRRAAERVLPGRVSGVVLFGSRARGDSSRASDYDVAVFVRGLEDHRAATRALVDAAYPHVLAGFHILPLAVPADYLESRSLEPLAASIARDGVAIP